MNARQSTRQLCLQALAEFRRRPAPPAEAILERLGRGLPDGSPDRAFLTELFYGVLRNLSLLDAIARHLRDGGVDPVTRDLLHIGLYQILLADIAEHAAVNETVAVAGRARGLVNAILRRAIREREEIKQFIETLPPHIRHSHPKFLYERWTARFGESDTLALLEANNRPPPICGRINTLKTDPERFFQSTEGNAEPLPAAPGGLAVRFSKLPRSALDDGIVYIQDPSTLLAPELLDPQPGEMVLDACAAPGGKASHLAALMQNRGRLIAADSIPARTARLIENLDRLGVTIGEVVRHDWLADPPPAGWEGRFDKILVDAPCSNTGVLRRRVDGRWLIEESDFQRMPAIQLRILDAVAPLLKPGGALVYSTCSIEPEENANLVRHFLETHSGWASDPRRPEAACLPHRDGWDGAFAARLIRAEDGSQSRRGNRGCCE